MVVTGRSGPRTPLEFAGLAAVLFRVGGEPTVAAIREGVRAAQEGRCDVVIAIGGGSAIDAGKAIAALLRTGPNRWTTWK